MSKFSLGMVLGVVVGAGFTFVVLQYGSSLAALPLTVEKVQIGPAMLGNPTSRWRQVRSNRRPALIFVIRLTRLA